MKCKMIFIGNSIVAGYPFSKGSSFVGVLRKSLKGDGGDALPQPDFAKSVGFNIVNKGVNGDTTAGIAARLQADVLEHEPDVVFIMTGTNDFIYRDATPEEAFENLEQIAARIEAQPGSSAPGRHCVPVYITPIPVDAGKAEFMWMAGCGISYDAVNRDIDRLSDLIRNSGRLYVDMNRLFAAYAAEVGDVDLVYLDGLHPLKAGHEFMAGEIARFIEQNLTRLVSE